MDAIAADKPKEAIPDFIYLGTYEDLEERPLTLARAFLSAYDYGNALLACAAQPQQQARKSSSRLQKCARVWWSGVSLSDTLLLAVTPEGTARAGLSKGRPRFGGGTYCAYELDGYGQTIGQRKYRAGT